MEHKDTKTQRFMQSKLCKGSAWKNFLSLCPKKSEDFTSSPLRVFVSLCSVKNEDSSLPLRASASLRTKKYYLLVC